MQRSTDTCLVVVFRPPHNLSGRGQWYFCPLFGGILELRSWAGSASGVDQICSVWWMRGGLTGREGAE